MWQQQGQCGQWEVLLVLCFCPLEGISVFYYEDTLPDVLPSAVEEAQGHRGVAQFSPTQRLWTNIDRGLNPCSTNYQLGEFLMSPRSLFSLTIRRGNARNVPTIRSGT